MMIIDKDGFLVPTIKEQNFNFSNPKTEFFYDSKSSKNIIAYESEGWPRILRINKLHFFIVKKKNKKKIVLGLDGVIVGKKLVHQPLKTKVLFDVENKRVKIFGKYADNQWVEVKNT